MTKGIVYIATANDVVRSPKTFIEEAEQSAQSVRDHSDLPITLITDQPTNAGDTFTNIVRIDDPDFSWRDKIKYLKRTPFDETLFLDTDTRVVEEIDEIFQVLNEYDLAVAQDPAHGEREHPEAPTSFPEYNTGVMLYKKSKKVLSFLEKWLDEYDRDQNEWISGDQPSFRKVLHKSNLRYLTLSREWNVRYTHPGMIAGKPRILHGRVPDYKRVDKKLSAGCVYFPSWFALRVYKPRKHLPAYVQMMSTKIKRDGFISALSSIRERI
jgi:hypothetical protein